MAKKLATVFGVVFTLVGLLGILGIGLGIVGPGGVFATDTVHDLVHLVSGLVFLAVAFWASAKSKAALVIFGVVYTLVAILGFLGNNPVLGFINVNDADNYLHLLLGVVILIAGFSSKKDMGGAMM